jgi:hypothetical protein
MEQCLFDVGECDSPSDVNEDVIKLSSKVA